MEDRQARIIVQVLLNVLAFYLFSLEWKMFVIALVLANGLAYAFMLALNFISSTVSSLIYGSAGGNDSYEGRFYQTDLDQARKRVRESRWDEAISFYRKIVETAPGKIEARFELARAYQIAGYTGLALLEYQKIKESGGKLGEQHPFVLESEKMIKDLRKTILGESNHSPPSL